jgi:hypothetical protein
MAQMAAAALLVVARALAACTRRVKIGIAVQVGSRASPRG